ncbi:hypothetical protein TKK_0008862 [Trichogramma kaykai]
MQLNGLMLGGCWACRCSLCQSSSSSSSSKIGSAKANADAEDTVRLQKDVEAAAHAAGSMTRSPGLPARRLLQALALVLVTAYATVLLYQAVTPRQWTDDVAVVDVNTVGGDVATLEIPSRLGGRFGMIAAAVSTSALALPSRNEEIEETTDLIPSVATATMAPYTTGLDDIFISVKTTKNYHESRLQAIIDTWFQFAKEQTWFFTDKDDPYFQEQTNGHMINTKCSSSHNRRALCCKMSVEFDRFLESGKNYYVDIYKYRISQKLQ